MVTEDDINMIGYFLNETGDIERWSRWEERKGDIDAQYPELVAALKNLKIAKRTLEIIAKSVVDNYA